MEAKDIFQNVEWKKVWKTPRRGLSVPEEMNTEDPMNNILIKFMKSKDKERALKL